MTHAETQDLLLDLAYGELDAERAAEVASHVEGCDECRKEKAAIEEARRLAGPLRELEEPSPGFDDRILAAARAQAQLTHEGNVGQVIEVTGSVRPLAMEPARIDAHGPVKARPAERHRPRWLMRVALTGSVAAAAALALGVSTMLETRRAREMAVPAAGDEFKIRVEPASPPPVDGALRDRDAKSEKERSEPQKPDAKPPKQQAAEEALRKDKVAQVRAPKNRQAAGEGSGGDVASARGKVAPAPSSNAVVAHLNEPPPSRENPAEEQRPVPAGSQDQALGTGTVVGGTVAGSSEVDQTGRTAEALGAPLAISPPAKSVVAGSRVTVPALAAAPPAPAAKGQVAAAEIENSAQQARHAGDYTRAAALYRQAATLREGDKDLSAAAWNLAHAVECLSAAGQLDEARAVREQLARAYPSETNALAAARRALREVDSPTPAQH